MGKQDFFLEPDDAQTMGDINYMRKSVRVRRTFPKTLKNKDGFAIEKQVSATEDVALSDRNVGNGLVSSNNSFTPSNNSFVAQTQNTVTQEPNNNIAQEPNNNIQPTSNPEERRQTDTNMDMFRNMARNIKKKDNWKQNF